MWEKRVKLDSQSIDWLSTKYHFIANYFCTPLLKYEQMLIKFAREGQPFWFTAKQLPSQS